MKKILIATTALVATAGVAAADVSLSGSARMGLQYDSSAATSTTLDNRVRIWFKASGETDGGLGWGAKIRIQKEDEGAAGAVNNSSVWISGGWGKLTFGDVASGDKSITGQTDGVGYSGNGDLNEISYVSDGNAQAIYQFSSNGLSAAISTSQFTAGSENIGVGIGYATDTWSVGLGYGESAADDQLTLKGSVTFGTTTVKAIYQDQDSIAEDAYGLSASGTFGAVGVTAFYTHHHDNSDDFGIGASYDLGGGANLAGGISRDDSASTTLAEIGITMKF